MLSSVFNHLAGDPLSQMKKARRKGGLLLSSSILAIQAIMVRQFIAAIFLLECVS
jgi:hypothetical protein